MSLALASKVKSLTLASKPQVLESCPVLGSRTTLYFELLKFCRSPEKIFEAFFWRSPENFSEDLFFGVHLRLCPWPSPRAFLSLASRGSVLKGAVLGLGLGFVSWPSPQAFLSLASRGSVLKRAVLGLEPCAGPTPE